ncbi:MAG: glycoside hydrolase family 65 protein [Dehalococcoidia bacterium]|nr:MAG: glycoside hydrolase family 65 protein [Dehalococcoidia bacterium]
MKGLYAQHTLDDHWIIKETAWSPDLQPIREVQFCQGNGYLGVKGMLESIPYDSSSGVFISGVYDKVGSQVDELVNLPNPLNFKFTIEGQKLDEVAMDVVDHKRALNMKKGLLVRRTLFQDRKKRLYEYESLRFISMHDKNIGAMQIMLTALDDDCRVDVHTNIDTSVSNAAILSEGRKKHFRVCQLGQYDNAGYLAIETFAKKFSIIFWSGFYYHVDGKKIYAKDNVFQLKIKKGQQITFTKIFYIKHSHYQSSINPIKSNANRAFRKIFTQNFSDTLKAHMDSWQKIWNKADVIIGGTANLQQNLRFNIYHMIICGPSDNGFSSVGARTLSGEGYRGHIFWDSEIFLLPFYLFVFPDIARNMLLYRYKRLDQARLLAKESGYNGARFPWESASEGTEETPAWARNIDGEITRVHTHEFEHHITADIAYAVYKYFVATHDDAFMTKYGYEMMFETARFWASRVSYNKVKDAYEIKNIIGPDEFHINVDNNYFTNMMAKWNILTACRLYRSFKLKDPKTFKALSQKINLKSREISEWKNIASKIALKSRKDGFIEQFDGYLKLKNVRLTEADENGIPVIPKSWLHRDMALSQLVKQADVLMLLYLLGDVFNLKTKKINYDYYIARTVHSSSLSASIHAAIAAETGDMQKAYTLFNLALRADISNIYGNTAEGIHAASLGGTWQAIVFGFAGIEVVKERLVINPNLPNTWNHMQFVLSFQRALLHIKLSHNMVRIRFSSSAKRKLDISVFGRHYKLTPKKSHTFNRKTEKQTRKRYYY